MAFDRKTFALHGITTLNSKTTPKMLSQQLRDLEECGMIHREVIPEKPPKTLYSLTAFGKSIIPVLDSMCNWGIHFLEGLDITPPCGSKL